MQAPPFGIFDALSATGIGAVRAGCHA